MRRAPTVTIFAASFCLLAGLYLLTCNDHGTGPVPPPPPEPPKDYAVYFRRLIGNSQHRLYRFTVLSHQLDSVLVTMRGRFKTLTVSADGARLFASDADIYRVFDATSLQEIDTLNFGGRIRFSPDGKYLSVTDSLHYLLDAGDYSVLGVDSLVSASSRFSADGRFLFLLWHDGTDYHVRQKNLPGLEIAHDINIGSGSVHDGLMEPASDGATVALYRTYVEMYDIATGQLIGESMVVPGLGDMDLDPIGNHLYFTGPGQYFIWEYGSFTLARWRVGRERLSSRFVDTMMYWLPCNDNGAALFENITVTPDGRWLVALDFYGQLFTVVDLETDSLAYCSRAMTYYLHDGPACQSGR